ncbi:MAG: lipid II flippase MurJ, partial [Variovorax sp.]
ASHLATGSVTWITNADRLMEFPSALLGVALGVVLMPRLASARAAQDDALFSGLLDWGLRLIVLLAVPCAVALLVFARPLVAVLFHNGAFSATDVQRTAVALMGYGTGLLGIVAIKVLAAGFYARHDMRTPMRISLLALALTQLLNIALVPWLQHAGLTLSIGLAQLLNALLLLIGLRRNGSFKPGPGWGRFIVQVAFATVLLGALLFWADGHFDWVALREQRLLRVGLLAAVIAGAGVLYFSALALTGVKLRSLLRR